MIDNEKTLKNKQILKNISSALFAVALVLGAVHVGMAQESEDAEASVSAEVLSVLSIVSTADVDFGNISATTDEAVTIDPNGADHAYLGTEYSVGQFTISGGQDTEVTIWFNSEATLENGEGGEMTFTANMVGDPESENQSTAVAVTTDADQYSLSNTGNFYLWLGGDLGTLDGQASGNYTTDEGIVVNVEYN
ncbi:MAG: DUF4402 domain-containing protein [Balneolales bacterium]